MDINYRLQRILEKSITLLKLDKILWRYLPPGLYVFNFHRIGIKTDSEFDRDIFSCTAKALENHLAAIKNNFSIISAENLKEIAENKINISERLALITFDDGYIDNYTTAYPILKNNGVPALFFLSTGLIGSSKVPWWDQIAFLLRNGIGNRVSIPGSDEKITLDEKRIDVQIQKYIQKIKRQKKLTVNSILENLKNELPKIDELQELSKSLFVSWDNVKEMSENNVTIGSHTVSHKILTTLTYDEQRYELEESKRIIESKISKPVFAFAYPVGSSSCYNDQSKKICKSAGYSLAFNNQSGVNKDIKDTFDIYRICVDTNSLSKLRFNVWLKSL